MVVPDMKNMSVFFFVPVFFIFLLSSFQVKGASLHLGGLAGVMTQPSSGYYHSVFGSSFGFFPQKSDFGLTSSFFYRPKVSSRGYTDYEYSQQILVHVLAHRWTQSLSLWVAFGGGEHIGVLKNSSGIEAFDMIHHRLKGVVSGLKLSYQFESVHVEIEHRVMTGVISEDELKMRVAWPFVYSFMSLLFSF